MSGMMGMNMRAMMMQQQMAAQGGAGANASLFGAHAPGQVNMTRNNVNIVGHNHAMPMPTAAPGVPVAAAHTHPVAEPVAEDDLATKI